MSSRAESETKLGGLAGVFSFGLVPGRVVFVPVVFVVLNIHVARQRAGSAIGDLGFVPGHFLQFGDELVG